MSAAGFWNGIIGSHAGAALIADRVTKAVTPARVCDDCGFQTVEQDVTVCPDPRCRGSVG